MGLISRVSSRTYRSTAELTKSMPRYSRSRSRSRSPPARERNDSASFRNRYEKDENKDSHGKWKKNETPSKCVGVFGLDWNTSERELERKMLRYGKVVKCVLVMNRAERRSKGFGFVTYDRIDDAVEAVEDMNGRTIEGRAVRVDFSYTKDEVDADERRGDRDNRREPPRSRRERSRSPDYVRRPKRSSRSPSPYRR